MDVKLLLVNKVPPFSGAPGQSWEQWISRFETQATGVGDDDRLHCLLMLLSGAALDLFANQLVKIDYEGAKKSLASRFGTAIGQIQAQAELAQASQEPGESVDDFADRLRRWGRLAYPASESGDRLLEGRVPGAELHGSSFVTRRIRRRTLISSKPSKRNDLHHLHHSHNLIISRSASGREPAGASS